MILPEVYLACPVTESDWQSGQTWPPDRCKERDARFTLQHNVSRGDFTSVIKPLDEQTVSIDRIGSFIDAVSAILLTTDPGNDITDDAVRISLQNMIDNVASDALKHGRGIMAMIDGELRWLDIRYAWPYGDTDYWAFVEPVVTIESEDGSPNRLRIMVWDGTNMGGEYREYIYGVIGDVVEEISDVPAVLSVVDRPPSDDKWGTPAVDVLVPIVAEMIRRDSSVSAVLDKHTRPKLVVSANIANAQTFLDLISAEGGGVEGALSAEDITRLGKAMEDQDVLVIPDGIDKPELLTWEADLSSAFTFLDHLDSLFYRITGMAPAEAGDSGHVESGSAIERRQYLLIARTARLFSNLYSSAKEVYGDFKWEYAGKRLSDSFATDSGMGEGDDE